MENNAEVKSEGKYSGVVNKDLLESGMCTSFNILTILYLNMQKWWYRPPPPTYASFLKHAVLIGLFWQSLIFLCF
jgi:hypothetical protein